MSYEIRKGWPSNGALDEVLMAADGATLTDGTVAVLDTSTGKWKTGALAADDTNRKAPLHAFVIAKEDIRHTHTGVRRHYRSGQGPLRGFHLCPQ